MAKTIGSVIEAATTRKRWDYARLARETGLPASWVRAVATDHIGKPGPGRLRLLADKLGLDYRELLALTDQLGAVEPPEQQEAPTSSSDIGALVAAITAQNEINGRLVAGVERLAAAMEKAQTTAPAWFQEQAGGMTMSVQAEVQAIRAALENAGLPVPDALTARPRGQ